MIKKKCDKCGQEERQRNLRRLNGYWLCTKCYVEVRKNHRNKTIEVSGIRGELRRLDAKRKEESAGGKENLREYQRKRYRDSKDYKVKEYRTKDSILPVIKGIKIKRESIKSNSFLTIQEKQTLLRLLMKRGLTFEETIDRIKCLVSEQSRIRNLMKTQNKSEEQIKQKQFQLLEELYNF